MEFKRLSILLAATALTGVSAPLFAQETPPGGASGQAGSSAPTDSEDASQPIVVTGTRIRGAAAIGETVVLEREVIVEAGQVDLGEALRSLPQNFSGGQNPGVGSGAGLVNSNISSASSANLRGLGADATLTLLNGHRLPYNSAFQGVDISAFPLAAIDRVEVLPDGASALYGSDAVGGVVNVILRPDFEGVTTSAQLGASTAGGYFRQQADIVGGTTWDGGGLLLAYDFAHNSQIRANQRSYAAALDPDATLFPSMRRHAAILSGHHELAPGMLARVDAFYSRRQSLTRSGTSALRITRDPRLEGYGIAPSLRVDISSGWQLDFSGVFGRDRTRFRTTLTPNGASPRITQGRYFNEVTSLEVGAEGPLFALGGGAARLAIGAGLRNNSLDFALADAFSENAFDINRRARFGYAELFLPFVSRDNAAPGFAALSLSAALRYEDYPGLDRLATPRLGISYSPFDGLALRASWARSFKAPTLYQQYIFYEAALLPAAPFGAGAAGETFVFAAGGNPDVKPERSRSWTAGFELKPVAVPGLAISGTWYDIDYDDRVVSPITGGIASAFSNPGYASLIDFSPEPAQLAALIADAQFGLQNFTGAPYDPANVVALVDNRNINVAAWAVKGFDARIAWEHNLGQDRKLSFDMTGSWLDSEQRITD
ncbi:TonB-dependent receptor domain-containing protein, partial [Erythrobacter sp.]|uniref:TonB-dependent receptor plug domain-containing protein n=1 Tax=Erythrobacter sp. TaxID=1042 RepID=UPI00311D4115